MSEERKTVRVLQSEVFNIVSDGSWFSDRWYKNKAHTLNEALLTIPQEDIYFLKPLKDKGLILIYWRDVPQCSLCGAGIINGKCHNCEVDEK